MTAEQIISSFSGWVATNQAIRAACVVGSHARGTARADSDVDFVLICDEPTKFLSKLDWLGEFGTVKSSKIEDWGLLKSIRTFYSNGEEVEFGVTSKRWAEVPADPGTAEVVANGMKILYDPEKLLERLQGNVGGRRAG